MQESTQGQMYGGLKGNTSYAHEAVPASDPITDRHVDGTQKRKFVSMAEKIISERAPCLDDKPWDKVWVGVVTKQNVTATAEAYQCDVSHACVEFRTSLVYVSFLPPSPLPLFTSCFVPSPNVVLYLCCPLYSITYTHLTLLLRPSSIDIKAHVAEKWCIEALPEETSSIIFKPEKVKDMTAFSKLVKEITRRDKNGGFKVSPLFSLAHSSLFLLFPSSFRLQITRRDLPLYKTAHTSSFCSLMNSRTWTNSSQNPESQRKTCILSSSLHP